jgi:primary-amine oxidase
VDFDPASVGRVREAPAPLRVEQPLGASFRVEGQQVSWQNWRFHFRIETRRGVVISGVRYQDGDQLRSILYEAGLSELFVPYMDPALGWYNLTYLDLGDNGSDSLPRPLEPRSECPENAVYFDSLTASDRGMPQQVPRSACLFERLGGEVAWTHRERGATEARARRDLVLRWVATIGNYDYVFDWMFRQDGSIEVGAGATGIVVVKGVPGRSAADQEGRPADARDDAYGHFVAENSVAVNHDHFFCFRLDLDVDGPRNSLVVDRLQTRRLPEDNPRRSVWAVEPRTAARESEARLSPHDGEAYWRVVNPSRPGPLGYPTSYQIRPGHSASSLLLEEDYPQRRAGFTRHALWVTPQRDDEVYAAGEYTAQSRGEGGLPGWTSADRPIEATDIVAWYTLGMHHVVRAEDWPVMPTVWHSFEIRPFDFFARNPALDLPRQ